MINHKIVQCQDDVVDIEDEHKYVTTYKELVRAGTSLGISHNVMIVLASASKDDNSVTITLSKFLDPSIFPNHKGALARNDDNLKYIECDRLEKLKDFSVDGNISYEQLRKYQQYCWGLTKMSLKDKIPAIAEVDLLWGLFGSYKDPKYGTVSVDIIYNFLKYNKLPESFSPNKNNQVTILSLVTSLITSLIISPFWKLLGY
jgi:hypothetical protein